MTEEHEGYDVSPDEGGWDFWLHEAKLACVGYSSGIDYHLIAVWRGIMANKFSTQIAEELNLSGEYVELLQSIFCSADWAEYGTSPRGCWPVYKSDPQAQLEKLLKWYKFRWGEQSPVDKSDGF